MKCIRTMGALLLGCLFLAMGPKPPQSHNASFGRTVQPAPTTNSTNRVTASLQNRLKSLDKKITTLRTQINQQQDRITTLQNQATSQYDLILTLNNQITSLQAQGSQSLMNENFANQQLLVEQNQALARLKNEIQAQEAAVAALSDRVRQEDAMNIESDAFDQDRAELQNQQSRLFDLEYQYQATELQIGLDRDRAIAQSTQNIINRRFAIQSLEDQSRQAGATYQNILADLTKTQDELSKSQQQLSDLEDQRQTLNNQLSELE